jgi:hypothetical protein
MKQIKEGLQTEIKRIKKQLKEAEKTGALIPFGEIYHKGMLEAYERTLNEINFLLKQSNK